MMIKHNFESLFFTITLKTIWNIFICTFILSIVLYGCAPKISEIRPIDYNFEDQNKLKVAILTSLVVDSISIAGQVRVKKKYNNINNVLINAFNKEKFKIVLNPIKHVGHWAKKDYYINTGKKLNVDYIIHIRFDEIFLTKWDIDKASYKIINIHSGESIKNHFTTTQLDTNPVANKLFGFFDNFISQHDDYKIAKKPKKEHTKQKNKISEQVQTYKSSKNNAVSGVKWAVVIGVSSYNDTRIPSLRYASADAKSFYNWLISPKGGRYAPARIKLLLNEKATYENMKDAICLWLKQALSEDTVIIYFAGHGSPDSPDSPDNLFLLPHDVKYDRISVTGFPMWDIESALKRFIKSKKVVIITDACHSGGVGQSFDMVRRAGRGMKVNPISTGFSKLSQVSDGVCVITASDEKQYSQESQKWGGGHGVFTYFLLKGLNGEADYNNSNSVTLGELTSYVSQEVRRATKNAQSPLVAGRYDPALIIGK